MVLRNKLHVNLFKLMSLVVFLLEAHANDLRFDHVCGNSKGNFSITQSELVVAKISEEEVTTVFMNFAPEYVFECKSNDVNTALPKINFHPNQERYKYNRFEGNVPMMVLIILTLVFQLYVSFYLKQTY